MEIAGKKVVDARKSLKITISPRDAASGKSKDPANCAAARAIIRTVADAKQARVHLGRTYIEYPDRWVRFKTPSSLKLEIASFDRGAKAAYSVGNYTLGAISPADRTGVRKHVQGKTSGVRRRVHIARIIHQIEGVRTRGANK